MKNFFNSLAVKQFILLTLLFSTNLAAFSYAISNLDLDYSSEFEGSQATCINDSSLVAGNLFIGGNDFLLRAFVWNKESGLVLLDPYSTAYPPLDLNNKSQVVGVVEVGDNLKSYYWTKESGHFLLDKFHPSAINDLGLMAGMVYSNHWDYKYSYIFDREGKIVSKLNIWNNLNLSKFYVKISNYTEYVNAMNSLNEVVGVVRFHGSKGKNDNGGICSHGFLWRESGCVKFDDKIPVDINEHSNVLLVSNFSEKGISWLWSDGKFTLLWCNGLAKALNDRGEIVGLKDDIAILWTNGTTYNLIEYVSNHDGWEKLHIANDINNRGEIVGRGIYRGKQTAFILTPINQ